MLHPHTTIQEDGICDVDDLQVAQLSPNIYNFLTGCSFYFVRNVVWTLEY